MASSPRLPVLAYVHDRKRLLVSRLPAGSHGRCRSSVTPVGVNPYEACESARIQALKPTPSNGGRSPTWVGFPGPAWRGSEWPGSNDARRRQLRTVALGEFAISIARGGNTSSAPASCPSGRHRSIPGEGRLWAYESGELDHSEEALDLVMMAEALRLARSHSPDRGGHAQPTS
jgi:hypothetical protein